MLLSRRLFAPGRDYLSRPRTRSLRAFQCAYRPSSAAKNSCWFAFPTGKGSGAVTAFSQADGFFAIDALASALDADSQVEVTLIGKSEHAPDLVIMGSHDIALDVVVGALSERGVRARTIAVGSLGGVNAASRGECDIAPVHLVDPATGVYNEHLTPGL